MKTKTHTTTFQYRVDFQYPVQIDLYVARCLMNKRKSSKLSAKSFWSSFCRMTHSTCKTKTDFKLLRKCLISTQMVKNRCVSSNRHQETIIALHGPYNGHLEHVFVLQNDPLNLQNEDRLQNTSTFWKLSSLCRLRE